MWHKLPIIAAFAVATVIGTLSDENEVLEIKALAEQLQIRARDYAEDGNTAAAAEMEQKANAVLQELERRKQQTAELARQRRTEELRRIQIELERHAKLLSNSQEDGARKRLAEIREQMVQNNAEIRRLTAEASQDDVPRRTSAVVTATEQLEHLRMAIGHLRKAGQDDLVEEVTARAAVLDQQLHPQAREPELAEILEHVLLQMEELRKEVSRLRTEVDELRDGSESIR